MTYKIMETIQGVQYQVSGETGLTQTQANANLSTLNSKLAMLNAQRQMQGNPPISGYTILAE